MFYLPEVFANFKLNAAALGRFHTDLTTIRQFHGRGQIRKYALAPLRRRPAPGSDNGVGPPAALCTCHIVNFESDEQARKPAGSAP
jgi:hypothetical protein